MSVPTTAQSSASRRRSSRTPGFFTRAQLEDDLGLSATERDTFERAGVFGPTQRRARGDTRPVLYSATDLALARVAMAAHRLGIRGEQLRRLVAAIGLKQGRWYPGWHGHVLVDANGDVDLVPHSIDLPTVLTARSPAPALLVLTVQVPGPTD